MCKKQFWILCPVHTLSTQNITAHVGVGAGTGAGGRGGGAHPRRQVASRVIECGRDWRRRRR